MKKSLYLSGLLALSIMFFAGNAKAQAPTFTVNPRDTSICQGLTADFMVAVHDTDTAATYTYVWLVQPSGSTAWDTVNNGGTYTGATSTTLSVLAVDTLTLYKYKCIVQDIDTVLHDTVYATSSVGVLTVMTAPATAGVIMGLDTVCVTGSRMFTDSVAGGMWASNNLTLGTIGSTGMFAALNAGIDTISYTVTNSCGTVSTTASVYILPALSPGTISGNSIVCHGATITLTETDTTGIWGSSDTSLATVDSGRVTTIAAGIDTIMYMVTDTNGCVSTAWHIIQIDSTLHSTPVSGPTSVCLGSNITLVDSNASELHNWMVSNGNASITPTGMLTGLMLGIDTVMYMDSNTCNSASALPYYVTVVGALTISPVVSPVTHICVMGTSVVLTDSTTGGYWMLSNNNASITSSGSISGMTPGMDTVWYLDSNACGTYMSAPFVISMDVPLIISGITGTNRLCEGTTVSLSDASPGGTWFSSNTTVALVDPSGNVLGRSYGTSTISYIVSNACGNSITTDTVWVETPAMLPSGPDSLGVGDSIMLYDVVTGGTWSKAATDTFISLTSSGKVIGLMVGNTTVTYTVMNLCGTSTATETVYVGAPPTVTGIFAVRDTVCLNGTLQLNDTTAGGVWSVHDDTASITAAGVVTGLYGLKFDTAFYTVTNSFGSTTVYYRFFINEPPVVAISMDTNVALGGIVPLAAGDTAGGHSTGGTWILKFLNGDTTNPASLIYGGGGVAIQLVIVKPGRFALEYISANTCGADTTIAYFETPGFFNSGVNTVSEIYNDLKIAPNPNTGSFNINLTSVTGTTAQVTITNVLGIKVKTLNINTNVNNPIILDEPSGLYFINAITPSGEKYSAKVIIK